MLADFTSLHRCVGSGWSDSGAIFSPPLTVNMAFSVSVLVAAILECRNEVGAVEEAVAVPIPFRPASFAFGLIRARLEDLNKIVAVEFTVEISIAEPGSLEVLDPDAMIKPIDQGVVIQVVFR